MFRQATMDDLVDMMRTRGIEDVIEKFKEEKVKIIAS